MLIVPVIAVQRFYPDDRNAWIIYALSEPGFKNGLPKFLDEGFIGGNSSSSLHTLKVGMRRPLEEQMHMIVCLYLGILMAVIRA